MIDQQLLIEMPTSKLLEEFGAGKPTPGSGCAAALMGLLAANLIAAVAKLTVTRGSNKQARTQAEYILDQIESIRRELTILFQRDADVFGPVIALRKMRDAANTPQEKGKFTALANIELNKANDILIEISGLCFRLIAHGIDIYKLGYKGAMGDAGAAVSAAIAGITTCIFVINLNVRSCKSKAKWKVDAQGRCEDIYRQLIAVQASAFSLVEESRKAAMQSLTLPFEDPVEGAG